MNVVAIGRGVELAGFALVGVRIIPASSDSEVVRAWTSLEDVGLVILSVGASIALEPVRADRPEILTAVVP
jgi:vacuolar-type H+-ATPase subunit F/Vma7